MRSTILSGCALVIGVWTAATAGAQSQRQSGVVFDRATVATLDGEVAAISTTPSPLPLGGGLHILVRMSGALYDVHLAPQWYLDAKDFTIATGDQVQLTGSRLTYEGKLVFLVARITLGNRTLTLRDSTGAPTWGSRRGIPPPP